MKASTARQHINAYACNTGPKVWCVVGKYEAGQPVRTMLSGLTYRQAKANARAIKESCGYADVVRMISDDQLSAALGPCGK